MTLFVGPPQTQQSDTPHLQDCKGEGEEGRGRREGQEGEKGRGRGTKPKSVKLKCLLGKNIIC